MVGFNGKRLDLTREDLESTINGIMGYLPFDMVIPFYAKALSKEDFQAFTELWVKEHTE